MFGNVDFSACAGGPDHQNIAIAKEIKKKKKVIVSIFLPTHVKVVGGDFAIARD